MWLQEDTQGIQREGLTQKSFMSRFHMPDTNCLVSFMLGGPLKRFNAILSLLHPLDRYALSRPTLAFTHTSRTSQPPHSKPLGKLNRAIVVLL